MTCWPKSILARCRPRSTRPAPACSRPKRSWTTQKRDFQRKEELLKRGVATQAVFDQSRATLLSSRAQLDQARRQLELANHNLDRSKLLAPFAGTIARVEVKSFAQVAAGQPIVTLYSDDRFEMSFLAPSATFQSLKVGQKVDVKIADMPELSLKGEIKELGSKAEQVSAFPVVVRLDNSAPGLNAGMSVEVTVEEPLIGGGSGFLVPLSVLVPEGRQGAAGHRDCVPSTTKASSTVKKAHRHGRRRPRQPSGRH